MAGKLNAHRKRVQAQYGLTLTGLYNVLEKLRSGDAKSEIRCDFKQSGKVILPPTLQEILDEQISHKLA